MLDGNMLVYTALKKASQTQKFGQIKLFEKVMKKREKARQHVIEEGVVQVGEARQVPM